jgi:inosine/xanthosine triphosphate pyrophosphatase family protein
MRNSKKTGCKKREKNNGKTFQENALKKARKVARLTNRLTIADDSGLVCRQGSLGRGQ